MKFKYDIKEIIGSNERNWEFYTWCLYNKVSNISELAEILEYVKEK